uniref:Nucleolar GTP-binding protein 1 n=1 Tax=Stygiella incarcerata TaxID=1712417 RepID=A0A192ZHV6_9EUKA|nr:nucleolar GTP-binding protein 1 [Stygiella incarcerata]|eukprot:TRINITY_DN1929_c0_g1_i1.p1 TRINITY_DN1929_c0_g1~~TRINITY_DN1929_c0_g1_i1.p1  ORF type:complete len:625 (-),score=197.79 TRINITY_DN1929_c0_g1_i1:216-2090(-)
MVHYNFKSIPPIPNGKELVDIILTRTQRKTPTVVHKHYEISRIKKFYTVKVQFTHNTISEKLDEIIGGFPRIDEIHPFYADLMNVLYDKDHYKLALGQLAMTKTIVDKIARDYIKMLRYGDSLYRCKQLKRAALGRMCTILRKQGPSLEYLEQVRQHLARLPSIGTSSRTLILCGYPNVGKSSFLNTITRADVEVHPYPFTTKSIFVGHTDYKYMQWQVLDTPGILDQPLEDRNTIEMQSITALAHLRATVLYFVDISETCGYSMEEQIKLFHSLRPLFVNKPVVVVCNKIDACPMESLSPEKQNLLATTECDLFPTSTMTQQGISEVKAAACERLLQMRVEAKLKGKKRDDVLQRLHMAVPKPRDGMPRLPNIPESVLLRVGESEDFKKERIKGRRLAKDLEEELGGGGTLSLPLRDFHDLKEHEWKDDVMPELLDGKNIADYVDADILLRLDELEREEDVMLQTEAMEEDDGLEIDEETQRRIRKLKGRKSAFVTESREKKTKNKGVVPRIRQQSRSRTKSVLRSKRERDEAEIEDMADREMEMDMSRSQRKKRRVAEDEDELPAEVVAVEKRKEKSKSIAKKAERKRNRDARKGEGDRHVFDMHPKHLLSGKRKSGTNQRR